MGYVDPISVINLLEQRRDLELVTRNPLCIKLNCCDSTCTATGYITKSQKLESFTIILGELEKHHKIDNMKVVCPTRVTPCEFCSDPVQAVLPNHVTKRLPRIASICGVSAVCQNCHYWTDGTSYFLVGTLCCDQNFSLSSNSKPGLISAFDSYIKTCTHYIDSDGFKGIHVKLHPTITKCPLCVRQL